MRTSWRRTWIKLYPIDCLDGSIRYQLEPDERGVWYDLLNFSAICATAGVISDKDNRAFPHSFIANRLNISQELLKRTLDKCKEEGRISEDSSGIHIVNWAAYQSEYERQKPYRQQAAEKVEAERGDKSAYTKDMFWEDHDALNALFEKQEYPFDEGPGHIPTWLFFRDKYTNLNEARDYFMRFSVILDFINKNTNALRQERLLRDDEATGKEKIEEEVVNIILDSFSPPKHPVIFPSSNMGELFDLSFDKVLEAVKPVLEEEEKPGKSKERS